jgi:UDP-GlcNAc:undecaprenyl-phosphate GlcNAc-1-phosphate transferase
VLTLVLIFASALLFAIGGTPVARRAAIALGMLDQPDARKLHKAPVPLLGGVAIYAACIAALLLFGSQFYVGQVIGILLGATWVSFLGIWDDWRNLRPLLKLVGQSLAALILIATGVQIEFLREPILNALVTIVFVVGITNAINFLDNMDGLSGGLAAVASAWFLVLSIQNGQYLVAPFAAALLGASLGFLVYNFNPASIFMGDAGSLFLGFILAAVAIKLRFPGHPDNITWMIPVLVLALPIFDTALVFISRVRRGVNPFTTAGKDHVSHRLARRGLRPKQTVLALYGISMVLGALAYAIQFATFDSAYALFVLALACALAGIWYLEFRRGTTT